MYVAKSVKKAGIIPLSGRIDRGCEDEYINAADQCGDDPLLKILLCRLIFFCPFVKIYKDFLCTEGNVMRHEMNRKKKKAIRSALTAVATVVLLIGFLLFFAARWYVSTYGNTGFDSILFTLTSG